MVIFLLEEPSMKTFLEVLLAKVFPSGQYKLIPHEGKSDLERSIPRKIRGMQAVATAFVIVRDQHSVSDCKSLKSQLLELAQGSAAEVIVRIVCRELESWLLGELSAIEQSLEVTGLTRQANRRKFRNPDQLVNAQEELARLCPGYSKTHGAKAVAAQFDPSKCCSRSFQVFFASAHRLLSSA
jgi:hypothetical protein